MGRKVLSREESQAIDIAIEMLVRIECREKGKGWWYRAKRRTQLVQTYLGSGGAIQGLGLGGAVNDVAVRLKTLADVVVQKYLSAPLDELTAAIQRDFPGDKSWIKDGTAAFVFPGSPDFQFYLHDLNGKPEGRSIQVVGRGELAGFSMFVRDGGRSWSGSTSDGIMYGATGAAKKLIKVMSKKYDVNDLSEFMRR